MLQIKYIDPYRIGTLRSYSDTKTIRYESPRNYQLTLPYLDTNKQPKLNQNSSPQLEFRQKNYKHELEEMHEMENRIHKLEARTRLIQNYHKQNLKVALSDKMKTFRLKSYIQRKDQQQTLLSEAQEHANQILQQKIKKIKASKLRRNFRKDLYKQSSVEKAQRIRKQAKKQKQEAQVIIQNNLNKILSQKKKIHNQIYSELTEQKYKRQLAKKLNDLRRKESREIQVKQQIQSIIKKQDKLNYLRQQLNYLKANQIKNQYI